MMNNWKIRMPGFRSAQRGVILLLAIVFLMIGALIIIPLLTYTTSGINSSKTYNEKAENLYAADAGIEDALWQIKYEHMNSLLVNPSDYNAFDYDTTWQYQLPDQPNGDTVTVTVDNVWIPKDIPVPGPGEATSIISSGRLMVTGGMAGGSTTRYNLAITYYAEPTDFIDSTHLMLNVNKIGVWLPPGFTYNGGCNLQTAGQPYYSVPTVSNHQGGQAVIWDFSSVPYNSFPDVNVDDSPITFDVSFNFTPQTPGTRPDAVGWISTSGVDDLSYAWDIDIKVFKITSTAAGTSVETYVAKRELRSMDGTVNGDYYAFGNSLMTDDNMDRSRENLHASSYSDVTGANIPDDAEVSAAYLYWSGWKSASGVFSDICDSSTSLTNKWTNGGDWAYNSNTYRGNHTGDDTRRSLTVKNSIDLSSYRAGMAYMSFDYYLTPLSPFFFDDCSYITTNWNRSGSNPYTDTNWKSDGSQFSAHSSGSATDAQRRLVMKNSQNLSAYTSSVALTWDQSVAAPQEFFSDDCSNITAKWTRTGSNPYTDTSWKKDDSINRYNGHSSGGDDSKNYLTLTNILDLSGFDPGTAAISWDQATSVVSTSAFSDDCSSSSALSSKWTQSGTDWVYDSSTGRYRGRHNTSSSDGARELILKTPLNLSSYMTNGNIVITWNQYESGTLGSSDGMNYTYSLDGGANWILPTIQAFRDDNPSATNSCTISNVTMPSQFLFKFVIIGLPSTNNRYCYIDNVNIGVNTDLTSSDGLNFSVSGDGGATWSGDYVAFRGANPEDANFTIPVEYQTSSFKIRFHLIGFTGTGHYCYISNIKIMCSYSHNDGLDYAFSTDGGTTWSENFEAFRGKIGSTPTKHTVVIPDAYKSANFKVRFQVIGNTDPGEIVYIDNIKMIPAYTSNDGLDVSFYNGSSWSENTPVFRGDIGSDPIAFKYAVPTQYMTSTFKMKLSLVGCNAAGYYCVIDNIAILVPDNQITFTIGDAGTGANPKQVSFENGDDDSDGIFYEPRIGSYSLYAEVGQVVRNYSGDTPHGYSYSAKADVTDLVRNYTAKAPDPAFNYPGHARYTIGAVNADTGDEWSYAGWSLIIIYVSGETQGHQLHLYDNFVYSNHDTTNGVDVDFDSDGSPGGNISDFIVPQQIEGETYAAKITCFVGEGDDWYYPDYIALNAPSNYWGANCKNMPNQYKLWDGTTSTYDSTSNTEAAPNNVWNGKSVGMTAQGIDVDTFNVTWDSGLVNSGDTSAHLDVFTKQDVWNIVYIIISFRDKTTTGGSMSYLIHN